MSRLFTAFQLEYLERNDSVGPYMALSAWFYPINPGDMATIFWNGNRFTVGDCIWVGLRSVANGSKAFIWNRSTNPSANQRTETTNSYVLNAWNHIFAIYKCENERYVWLNGGGLAAGHTSIYGVGYNRISIGRAGDSTPDSYFNGRIAEVAFWQATPAWSLDNIAALAKRSSPFHVRPYQLEDYWPLIRDLDRDIIRKKNMTPYNSPGIASHPPIIYSVKFIGQISRAAIELIGSATGVSDVDGSLHSADELIGSAAGIAGAFGSLNTQPRCYCEAAVGVSDVPDTTLRNVTRLLVGIVNGVSGKFAQLKVIIQLQGSTAGVSGVVGRFEPVLIGFYESLTNQITSYFNAFADVNDLAVRYDNDPRPTPSSGLWCECGVDLGSTEQSELGISSFRNVSNFNIRIKNSIGLGMSELLKKADIVATTFRRKNLNRIIFEVPRIVKVGRIEDNYQVNVICPFFVDKVDNG